MSFLRLVSEARGVPFLLDRGIDSDDKATNARAQQLQQASKARAEELRARADAVLHLHSLREQAAPTAAASVSPQAESEPQDSDLPLESRRAFAEVIAHYAVPPSQSPASSSSNLPSASDPPSTERRSNDPCTAALYAKLCERAEGVAVDARRYAASDNEVARHLEGLRLSPQIADADPAQKPLDSARAIAALQQGQQQKLWARFRSALGDLEHPESLNLFRRGLLLRKFVGTVWMSQVR